MSTDQTSSISKPKLLWVGDAVAHTGFATVTHEILAHLQKTWDVSVLGINYLGDPHTYPYQIYRASVAHDGKHDQWGLARIAFLCNRIKPDIVCVNNDPWNVANFVDVWRQNEILRDVPMAAYMPIDAVNQDRARMEFLNKDETGIGLDLAIWYTKFGQAEAERSGYIGRSTVIGHSVSREKFHPVSRDLARELLLGAKNKDIFIIGAIGRNSFRKRQDLLIEYVGEFLNLNPDMRPRTLLYLHSEKDKHGWDFHSLGRFHRVSVATPSGKTSFAGTEEEDMRLVYGMLDIQATTTMGEGWGLPTMEGFACGIPQIVPKFAALGEWVPFERVGAYGIQCYSSLAYTQTNSIGMIPDKQDFVDVLEDLAGHWKNHTSDNDEARVGARELLADITCSEFPTWEEIAARFDEELREVILAKTLVAAEVS